MEIGAWRAPCGSNWEGRKQRRNLARKAEKRCLTANLDGSSAKIILLVFRCDKAARCLGRKRRWRLWMHRDLQVFPSWCCEDVTMQIFDILLQSQWCSLSLSCVIAGGDGVWALPNTASSKKSIHVMDYVAKPTPLWAVISKHFRDIQSQQRSVEK